MNDLEIIAQWREMEHAKEGLCNARHAMQRAQEDEINATERFNEAYNALDASVRRTMYLTKDVCDE
jgi:hypothetical protein